MPAQQLKGAAVAGTAAAALLVIGLMDWFTYPGPGDGVDLSMWQSFTVTDLVAALAIAIGLLHLFEAAVRRSIPGAIAFGSIAMSIGGLAFILLAIGVLTGPDGASTSGWALAGLAASLAIPVGGYIGVLEDRPGTPADPA